MRQTKISYWLKGIVVLLGLMGIVFFGGLTAYACYARSNEPQNLFWTFIFFSWYTAVLCYVVLIEFWKVCTQIGNDNSFSKENARCFCHMRTCGVLGAAGFAVRLCYLAVEGVLRFRFALFSAVEICIALVFAVLCEALSQLIINAYEMKQENELTI